MKGIILAAGQGNRMGSKTTNQPKCMLNYNNKSLIKNIIEKMNSCNINDIVVVNGYKSQVLEKHLKDNEVKFVTNSNFKNTNMVNTLFCAENEMNDDLIVSYSDIIYKKNILKNLIQNQNDIAVTVDKNWYDLWKIRMDNPLQDAETMKIDKNGDILELGKKPNNYEQINGQYIGLIKISKNILTNLKNYYHELDKNKFYDGEIFNNMYMTSFIQLIINNLSKVNAELISGGWLEFDTKNDIHSYINNNLSI